jgi:hypothetical protein
MSNNPTQSFPYYYPHAIIKCRCCAVKLSNIHAITPAINDIKIVHLAEFSENGKRDVIILSSPNWKPA